MFKSTRSARRNMEARCGEQTKAHTLMPSEGFQVLPDARMCKFGVSRGFRSFSLHTDDTDEPASGSGHWYTKLQTP
jgi:hypothetical protein